MPPPPLRPRTRSSGVPPLVRACLGEPLVNFWTTVKISCAANPPPTCRRTSKTAAGNTRVDSSPQGTISAFPDEAKSPTCLTRDSSLQRFYRNESLEIRFSFPFHNVNQTQERSSDRSKTGARYRTIGQEIVNWSTLIIVDAPHRPLPILGLDLNDALGSEKKSQSGVVSFDRRATLREYVGPAEHTRC